MFGLGMSELIIILVIIVILFGAKRIPEIAAGVGKGIVNFKKATRDFQKETLDTKNIDDNKEDKEKEQERV